MWSEKMSPVLNFNCCNNIENTIIATYLWVTFPPPFLPVKSSSLAPLRQLLTPNKSYIVLLLQREMWRDLRPLKGFTQQQSYRMKLAFSQDAVGWVGKSMCECVCECVCTHVQPKHRKDYRGHKNLVVERNQTSEVHTVWTTEPSED